MDAELLLEISAAGQSPGRHELVLAVRNVSARRQLIPVPEVIGFFFRRLDDGTEAQWETRTLESRRWRGVVLDAGAGETIAFSIVAWDARTAAEKDPMHPDFKRWGLDLHAATYEVTYRLWTGYYDPDTHYQLADLVREAAARGADAWRGDVTSNVLRVAHR
jgi:hypothetical protein